MIDDCWLYYDIVLHPWPLSVLERRTIETYKTSGLTGYLMNNK